jgi:hypothetical protein
MKLSDFFWNVEADKRLRGIDLCRGDTPAEDTVIVEDMQSTYKTAFAVPVILELPWEELRAMATGEKDIAPLYHVTRIVGYFSRVENWNNSKIGELRDRRAGDYEIKE